MKAPKTLIPEIRSIKESIFSDTGDGSEISQAIRKLEKIILYYTFTKQEETEIFSIFGTSLHRFYNTHFFEPNIRIEKRFADQVIKNKKFDARKIQTPNLIFNGSTALLREEIKQSGIKSSDTIAFVGSGPFPFSALVYYNYSKATIHCIEKDKKSCAEARNLIKQLGLESKIQVIQARGEEIQNQDYALVSLALQAQPKDAILKNLAKVLNANTKIVFRAQSGLGTIFTESEDSVSHAVRNLFILERTLSRKDGMMKSHIYTVK